MTQPNTQALIQVNPAEIVRKVALSGNLKPLSESERWSYYEAYCKHLGLEPTTRPFDIMERDGKVSLYPNANCAAQLGEKMHLSFPEYKTEVIADCVFVYRVLAKTEDGREAWGTGAVPMGKLPLEIASAIKKAETQAKRRVTLSLGGLGLTDSDEMADIGASVAMAEPDTEKPKRRKPQPEPQIIEAEKVETSPVATTEKAQKPMTATEATGRSPKSIFWDECQAANIDAKQARAMWQEAEGDLSKAMAMLSLLTPPPEESGDFLDGVAAENLSEPMSFDEDEPPTPQQAAFDAQAPLPRVTGCGQVIKDDNVGLNPSAFWKWVKFRTIDRTKPNALRIEQIIRLNSTEQPKIDRAGKVIKGQTELSPNWQAVIHQVKQEFGF